MLHTDSNKHRYTKLKIAEYFTQGGIQIFTNFPTIKIPPLTPPLDTPFSVMSPYNVIMFTTSEKKLRHACLSYFLLPARVLLAFLFFVRFSFLTYRKIELNHLSAKDALEM